MDNIRESILNQTDVSLSLTKHVISACGEEKNIVFSPLSINLVLAMTAAGSGGSTRDQLLSFLKSNSVKELNWLSSEIVTRVLADGSRAGGPRLSRANGVWVDQSVCLKPSFLEIAESAYKAAIRNGDFQNKADKVRGEVNMWAEKETNGLIKEILPPNSVSASTSLILANAVYFKGSWDQKFPASATKYHEFFLSKGGSVRVPFMTSCKKQYISAFNSFKVLRLPYKQGEDTTLQFSMYIYLPNARDGLPALIDRLCSESAFIQRHLPHQQVNIGDFRIPKFKIAFGLEASDILKGQGLVLPFVGGGLTEMVDDSNNVGHELYVSRLFHKSFVEVNEDGTEAAAVTAAVFLLGSAQIKTEFDFVADHPFMFVIREDTSGVVLFIGQVLNPLAG